MGCAQQPPSSTLHDANRHAMQQESAGPPAWQTGNRITEQLMAYHISNLTERSSGSWTVWLMKAAPTVTLESGSKLPRAYCVTRQDLPTPESPACGGHVISCDAAVHSKGLVHRWLHLHQLTKQHQLASGGLLGRIIQPSHKWGLWFRLCGRELVAQTCNTPMTALRLHPYLVWILCIPFGTCDTEVEMGLRE